MKPIAWMSVLATLLVGSGCATTPRLPSDLSERQRELNHGYALLYEVVSKQTGMESLFLLKSPSTATRELIRDIVAASRQAKEQLEAFAQEDAAIVVGDMGLPVVEQATRQAVETTTRNRLLFGNGFETRLLLTQVESSNYLAHLAATLARQEQHAARREQLNQIAANFEALNDRIIARLSQSLAPAEDQAADERR